MRIQNNITAMNTHRMYTINNDNVAKSAEKLSSGYRINRAGDDAAGLAISEKMRAQIRGLNMATKNSQDAISLVQTAEGALQETQNMLQRMSELAVQAATGTNEGFDRIQAGKEFEQLKREINDVAEQTNFNNMKILDGSLSYEGYIRSAQTAGVNKTEATTDTTQPASAISIKQTAAQAAAAGTAGKLTFTDGSWKDLAVDTDKVQDIKIKIDGVEVEVADKSKLIGTNDGTDVATTFANSTAIKFEAKDGTKFTFDATTGVLTTDDPSSFDLNRVTIELSQREPDKGYGTGTKVAGSSVVDTTAANTYNGVAKTQNAAGVAAKSEITVDQEKLNNGDSVTIGDKTYMFLAKAADGKYYNAEGGEVPTSTTRSGDTIYVKYDGSVAGDAAAKLAAAVGAAATRPTAPTMPAAIAAGTGQAAVAAPTVTNANFSASATGNVVTVTQNVTWSTSNSNETAAGKYKLDSLAAEAATKSIATSSTAAGTSDSKLTTTVEFDVAKMKDGDEFTIKSGNDEVKVKFEQGDTRKSFMQKVEKAFDGKDYAKVKGNAVIVDDRQVDLDLKWNEELNDKTNAIRIQVGANENEQLGLAIDAMNTAGLKLDDAHLTVTGQSTDENIDSAGAAITAVKAAINKVSDQRATLGAMQNRLDHKIASLKVSSENLSAAESRIRDVDMASEMTNFTKNNILSQAATAMLAQANALPQNVLSLLG